MEGQPHALASLAEPAYLTTGDPGNSGGGTLQSYDTQRLQSGYEKRVRSCGERDQVGLAEAQATPTLAPARHSQGRK